MSARTALTADRTTQDTGTTAVVPFHHPQGCRSYLIADRASAEALALDVHLDLVSQVS